MFCPCCSILAAKPGACACISASTRALSKPGLLALCILQSCNGAPSGVIGGLTTGSIDSKEALFITGPSGAQVGSGGAGNGLLGPSP